MASIIVEGSSSIGSILKDCQCLSRRYGLNISLDDVLSMGDDILYFTTLVKANGRDRSYFDLCSRDEKEFFVKLYCFAANLDGVDHIRKFKERTTQKTLNFDDFSSKFSEDLELDKSQVKTEYTRYKALRELLYVWTHRFGGKWASASEEYEISYGYETKNQYLVIISIENIDHPPQRLNPDEDDEDDEDDEKKDKDDEDDEKKDKDDEEEDDDDEEEKEDEDIVTIPEKIRRFSSVEEAYDDHFDLKNKEERARHDALKKVPLEKMIKMLRTLIKRINNGVYSLQTWARFKMGCYEGYGWDENRFITDIFLWPMSVFDNLGISQIDLKWEMLDSQMLCFIVWFALINDLPESVKMDKETEFDSLL